MEKPAPGRAVVRRKAISDQSRDVVGRETQDVQDGGGTIDFLANCVEAMSWLLEPGRPIVESAPTGLPPARGLVDALSHAVHNRSATAIVCELSFLALSFENDFMS